MEFTEQKIGFKQFSNTFSEWVEYLCVEEEFVSKNASFIAQMLNDAYIVYCSRENYSISQLAIDFSHFVRNLYLVCTHVHVCACNAPTCTCTPAY